MAAAPSIPILAVPMRTLSRGLTLLEVLAVLAVVAILASMALPSMAALAQRHQLVAAANALASDLSEARLEAARSGQVLHVQSESGPYATSSSPLQPASGHWCWAVATQAGCDCQAALAPPCRLKAVRAADNPGVQLLQPVQVRLDPLGTAQSSPAGAELQSPQGDRLRVEVGPLGRSRICVPDTLPARSASARYPAC